MAQEKRTFKWGDQEYLLDDLLKAHSLQENNYYTFAKDKGRYNDEALKGLRSAIANRINLVKNGVFFDADGTSASDQVDNVSIKTKNRIFRKDEYVDQDNTEWAKHYLNKLVATLNPHKKSEDTSKDWDINKYGLSAYLTGQGLNAQDVFEKLDLQDEENPENPRSFEQRHGKLREYLNNYKTWLQGKGFDFTKNDNEWDDDFISTLDGLINNSDWSDTTSLSASLRKLGSNDAYTTAFTSDRWDLSKTNDELKEERKKAAEEKKKKEERDNWNKYATDSYNAFMGLEDNNLGGSTYFTTDGDGYFDMSDEEYEKWLNTHTEDKDAYMRNLQNSYYENPFDTKIASEYLPLAGRFGGLKEVNIDGKTYKYDPRTIDRNKNRFVAFDPESGEMRHAFLWDIEEEGKALQRKWRIDNGYEDASAKYQMKKDGGLLYMQTGGGFNLAQSVNRDLEERNKIRAEETGNTEEVQKARDRVVSNGKNRLRSEKDSIAQPDAGFTNAERARLATMAADIGSMFLDPVTGTAVGLGSSLVNFGADIADDGFQLKDVGNLGVNIGFDLLGAIPLFGDAVGTGTKITRQLLKWAPRIMTGLTAYQGIKNFDGMMESWGKLTSGDKDQKMTVQDWRNITQSIGLITGGVRSVRNKAAQSKMKKAALVDDVVGINVTDKNGNKQQILVDGDTAKNIRAAKGDKAKIEAELSKLETFKDSFGEKGTLTIDTKNNGSLQNPISRREKAGGGKEFVWDGFRKEGSADVTDIYDFSKVKGYEQSRGFKIPWVSDYLNTKHQQLITRLNNGQVPSSINAKGAKTVAEVDAEVKKLQDPVDAEVKKLQEAMTKRSKDRDRINQQLTPEKAKLVELQKRLHGVADEPTLQVNKTTAEQNIAGIDANISKMQNDLATAESNLQSLEGSRVRKKDQAAHAQQVNDAKAKVDDIKNQIVQLESAKRTQQAEIAKIDGYINDYAALAPQQTKVQKLQDLYKHLGRGTHTNSLTRLKQMVADLQTQHSTVEGRQINWDMNEILKNAGIKNAYAQGGSINRNKLNKFLNYGKR